MIEMLIGSKMEVIDAKNRNLLGIAGKIVDETKNTITVETGKVQISVSKDGYSTTVVDEMLEDSKTREIVLEQLRR